MKKYIALIAGMVLAMGVLAANASAEYGGHPPKYCLNGQDTTLPTSVSYKYNGMSETKSLTEGIAEIILDEWGGNFLVGRLNAPPNPSVFGPPGSESSFAPGYTANTLAPGACAPNSPKHVPVPPKIAVCSPVVVDRPGDRPGIFLAVDYAAWKNPDGPYAKMAPANFVEGAGLTCDNPPAGFTRRGTAGHLQNVSAEPGYPLWVRP